MTIETRNMDSGHFQLDTQCFAIRMDLSGKAINSNGESGLPGLFLP